MNKIIINVAKTDLDFIGISCKNETMNITFPIGYDIKEQIIKATDKKKIQTIKKDTLNLLQVLEINQDTSYIKNQYKFSYSAANYLINDYFHNNLYQEKIIANNKLNNGSINWPQTIHSTIPIYTTGNFIYTNPITQNIRLTSNDITNIQINCLNQAFSILGIFYDNYYLPTTKPLNKENSLYILNKTLTNTNKDHEKKLITTLIKFITGTSISTDGEKELKIGTFNFHTIWEKHLKKYLTKQYPEKYFLPKAYYISNNNKINTSSQKPDIIIENENYIYLIDAKYYKINNLPQSADIHKQLCYANYINEQTSKKIINIFLLPNNINTKPNYTYYGYATATNFENQNGGKIHTLYLDTKSILNNPTSILKTILNIKY